MSLKKSLCNWLWQWHSDVEKLHQSCNCCFSSCKWLKSLAQERKNKYVNEESEHYMWYKYESRSFRVLHIIFQMSESNTQDNPEAGQVTEIKNGESKEECTKEPG